MCPTIGFLTPGVRPIQFTLVCAVLTGLQRRVWHIIAEKTGQLKKSPYD